MHWTKFSLAILGVLFLLPILIGSIPKSSTEIPQQPIVKRTLPVAMANPSEPINTLTTWPNANVLIYFAHPEEAYKPITEQLVGTASTSHKRFNIQSLSEVIKEQFELQLLETDILKVNVAAELSARNLRYKDSYEMIRPFVHDAILEKEYDLILDIHRDALKRSVTTLVRDDVSFAKIAFVIGGKHAGYEANYAYANRIHEQLETLVPGISRGLITKTDAGSNGIYNQDLGNNVILIELGGIDNTEEELIRSVSVLARAIANLFQNEQVVLLKE